MVDFKAKIVLLSICVAFGCAATAEIFPSEKDTYTVIIRGGYMADAVKKAYEKAKAFCEKRGKVMEPIGAKAKVPDFSGTVSYYELTFRALDQEDPKYKRPLLEPVPDTKIEVHSE